MDDDAFRTVLNARAMAAAVRGQSRTERRHHSAIHIVSVLLVVPIVVMLLLVVLSSSGSSNASGSLASSGGVSGGLLQGAINDLDKLGDDIKNGVEKAGSSIENAAKDVAHYANPGNWF